MDRILVVEDDPAQAHLLRSLLASEGFDVEVARDGQEGLDRFRAADFGLVLTDVVMPGLSGYDLCRRIKDDPDRGQVPVALLTALGDPADILQGLACGADDFLTKPLERDDLLGRVRGLFAARARRARGGPGAAVEVCCLGRRFSVTADKGPILNLLLSTCEGIARANRALEASQAELRAAQAKIEEQNERLRSQARLCEEKYRTLMGQANDAIFLLDPLGRVLEANRRAEELLGRRRGELLGWLYADFVPPAERERQAEAFRLLLADGAARSTGTLLRRADDRPVSVDWSGSVVEVGGERVVLVIARDVTRQQRVEEALRRSEARFHSFMDHSPAAAWIKDEHGRYVYANRSFQRERGLREDFCGRRDSDVWPEEAARQIREHDLEVLASDQPVDVVETLPGLDGVPRHWWKFRFPLRGAGGSRYVGGMAVEVTERLRAEEALQESEQRLRLALDHAQLGLWDWDIPTGKAVYDATWAALLGYREGEIPDRIETWEGTTHPEDLQKVWPVLEQHLQSADGLYDVVYRARKKDGQWVWVNARGRVQARDAHGNAVRMVGTIQDVTRAKQAEAELAQKNKDLEALLHVISHDLREPLRAVLNFAHLAHDRCGGALDAEGKDFLMRIARGADRLDALLQDILITSPALSCPRRKSSAGANPAGPESCGVKENYSGL
jgi:PAS domain S-box-containing protein